MNPIERILRMVKSDFRRNRWDDSAGFNKIVDELAASTTGANREKLEILTGENEQLFEAQGALCQRRGGSVPQEE
jgi:hypothetical protein